MQSNPLKQGFTYLHLFSISKMFESFVLFLNIKGSGKIYSKYSPCHLDSLWYIGPSQRSSELSEATILPNIGRGMRLCCSTGKLSIDWGIQCLSEKENVYVSSQWRDRLFSSLPLTDSTSRSAGFARNSMDLFLVSGDVGTTIKPFSSRSHMNDFFLKEGWF